MNLSRQAIVRRLRPPALKPVQIIYPYQREFPPNLGYTLAVDPAEPVVAPGDGTVEYVKQAAAGWRFKNAGSYRTKTIRIDHGQGIKTYVSGLGTVVPVSPNVTRGQLLGYSAAGEIFFAVEVERSLMNPVAINDFFSPRDGKIYFEQPNFMTQAPTVIKRLASTISDLFYAGLNYLLPVPPPVILFNVAFNGDGSKVGLAAVGSGDDDYWNVYAPVDFFVTGYACYYVYYSYYGGGQFYNLPVMVPLNDYRQAKAKVFLERVPPMSSVSGVGSSWDDMLAGWIGGYSGATPFVNTFRLRGLPSGSYTLYLYSEQGTNPQVSYFQVTVDGGTTFTGNTNPTGATSFLLNDNYVAFDLSLGYRSVVEITVNGYLSGLQIRRVIS